MAQRDERRIAALLRERDGLVQRGKDERVAQVDEELARLGHASESAAEGPGVKGSEAEVEEPKGRVTKTARQRTAAKVEGDA